MNVRTANNNCDYYYDYMLQMKWLIYDDDNGDVCVASKQDYDYDMAVVV